ncbi:hypothetical protein QFZ54_003146 [Sphingomonas faeni]|nr:hypothetical protein [Sphingomonas faeni]
MISFIRNRSLLRVSVAASALCSVPATAQSPSRTELEARVHQLEDAVARLEARLARSDVSPIASPVPTSDASVVQVANVPSGTAKAFSTSRQTVPPTPDGFVAERPRDVTATPGRDGFTVDGTTVRLTGQFKTVAASSRYSGGAMPTESIGRDFYSPAFIPVGDPVGSHDTELGAKQTRLTISTATPIGNHELKGLLEMDFQVTPGTQANQRVVNGYNPGLRRAFLTYGRFLAGQEFTTWQYLPALPETTDFVGPAEGTVFARQAQFRYTQPLSSTLSLAAAVENPETVYATVAAPVTISSGSDPVPDFATRLNWKPGFGEFSLGGVVRRLTVGTATGDAHAFGWGVSLAGKVPFGGGRYNDARFMMTAGDGVGRYVGFALVPDAILAPTAGVLKPVELTAGFAAVRIGLFGTVRSSLAYSFQNGRYVEGYRPLLDTKSAWSGAFNVFVTPFEDFDVGVEYRHGNRAINNGSSGNLDRSELSVRYTF